MKEALLCLTLLGGVACSRPPATFNNPYTVTAMLNDSVWFGAVQAVDAYKLLEHKPCAANKVTLFIKTDIPYPNNGSYSKSEVVNGCAGDCVPTQRLTFFNVPRKKGKYAIDKLNDCGMLSDKDVVYSWHVNGSGLNRVFRTQANKTNWVRVTRYDSATNTLEGRFKATLVDFSRPPVDANGRVAQFREGRFIAKLPK